MASDPQREALFLRAEHVVSAVQSRLAKDPVSVPPRLWVFQQQPTANRLWALRQQALVGSCEAARASKTYPGVRGRAASDGRAPCVDTWPSSCCLSVVSGDNKMKLWQMLGEMPAEDAQTQYVRVVTDLLPEWGDPQPPDAALLRTWTPDDDSDECASCGEAFTFLNRRHHCRRCLSLVCAVCSPHSLPLRVFSQQTTRRQRLCVSCYKEVAGSVRGRASSSTGSVRSRASSSAESVRSRASSTEDSTVTLASSSTATSAMAVVSSPLPLTVVSPSTAIHTGPLEFLHVAGGFRKVWRAYFFVLLVRKGSLGMFLTPPPGPGPALLAAPTDDSKKRPTAVFKLSGYTLRVRAQKRRPHQFRLAHPTKKPLHFAAGGMDDLRAWLAALLRAVECANELERDHPSRACSTISGTNAPPTTTAKAGGETVEKEFMEDVDAARDNAK